MRLEVALADVDKIRMAGDDDLRFSTIAEREIMRRWRPALVLGQQPRAFLDFYFGPHGPGPWAGTISLEEALVFGDGLVIDRRGRLLCGDSLMYPEVSFPYAHSPVRFVEANKGMWAAEIPDVSIELAGLTALLVCDGWPIYGHWLIDLLPRLKRLIDSGQEFNNFLLPAPLVQWQKQMLAAAGVPAEKCVEVDLRSTSVRCDRLMVPSYERFGYEARPTLHDIHDEIGLKLAPEAQPERCIFVARPHGNARRLINRLEVETVVQDVGYELVKPEELSFIDQVRLFQSARVLLGEFGSAMHNSLFSGTGTRIGLIQSATNFNLIQSQLAMIKNQDVFYALGRPEVGDDFSMDLDDVEILAKTMMEH